MLKESERISLKPGLDAEWEKAVENNRDPYGYGVVEATILVCKALDDPNTTPQVAERSCYGMGITGFMAGCMAQWVSHFHPRGEEFRRWWNTRNEIGDEGKRANESGGVLNPAILNLG